MSKDVNLSNCIVVLNDGGTFTSLEGCEVIELHEMPDMEDDVHGMCNYGNTAESGQYTKDINVKKRIPLGDIIVNKTPVVFFDLAERRIETPLPGNVLLSNGALVLLCKPLPHVPGGGKSPVSIVLCRVRSTPCQYVTWVFDESTGGCTSGTYHGDDLSAAVENWLVRS